MDRLLVVLLSSLYTLVAASKLNVPRVLLPYSDTPPKFDLLSESGCFRWSSTRPEVVRVEQDQAGCSVSAGIQAFSKVGTKSSAMVLAEDTVTGLLLRADVILDQIHSLKIVTRTQELYLEETPEKFEVRAYDEQGNEFSSLKGIKFRWTVEVGGHAAGSEILRFMTWRDSPYNTEPSLEALEEAGHQGNKVLLEGIKTGSARVTVRLVDPQHSTVPPATESLMVVANLFLLPPSARILSCAALPYTAQQFRANRLHPVALPSPHHQLVVPPSLGTLDKDLATVLGSKEPAKGLVELVDKNVAPGEVVKTPTAELSVVEPARLELTCLPHKSWSILANREVTIKVEVLDEEGMVVYPSSNLLIQLRVDEDRFSVTSSLKNGTLTTGLPRKFGPTVVTATLLGVEGCPLPTPLTSSATLEVWEDMVLTPALTLLPWDPVSQDPQHKVPLHLQGGDSPLVWSSANTNLASVSQLGVVTASVARLGEASISVSMSRALHCQASSRVVVKAAAKLALLESQQEVEVGTSLSVPLDLATNGAPFSRCSNLPYTVEHSDSIFTTTIGRSEGIGCATATISAPVVSHSKLSVSWTFPSSTGDLITLSDTKVVATYSPLTPALPSSGHTVLALGSGRSVAWRGGPLPWPLAPELHLREVVADDPGLVTVSEGPAHPSLHVYRVDCKGEGETQLTLTVGNKAGPSLPKPVSLSSTVTVVCSRPHTISLAADIPRPTDPSLPPCPLQALQGRQAAHHNRDLVVLVTLRDSQNRVLDSAENVEVAWAVSGDLQLDLQAKAGILSESLETEGVSESGPLYQVLISNSVEGQLDLTATIPREGGLLGSSSHSDTLQLSLVEQVSLSPSTLDLFEMEVGAAESRGGSGYFSLATLAPGVEADYSSSSRALSLTPLKTGVAKLALQDLCLAPHNTQDASLLVSVSGLAKLELQVPDKVQVGAGLTAEVTLLDQNQVPLQSPAMQHIEVELVAEEGETLVGVGGLVLQEGARHQAQFQVEGLSLGLVTLVARATYKGQVISSTPSPVTIYPPLALEPRNISLVIGAAFQFTYSGGPADCQVEFSVGDQDIATTSTEGVVTSLTLGTTSLKGRAVGRDGTVYSEDSVSVVVRPLSSLQLVVPASKVLVGSLVPVTLYGQDSDMNVYSYGSALPFLKIAWTVTGPGYGDLESPLGGTGHLLGPHNSGVVVFRGGGVGKSTITATVSISSKIDVLGQFQLEKDATISVSTTITVVDRLELINTNPRLSSGGLLLAPESSFQLAGNKAGTVYSMASQSPPSLGLGVTKGGLVTAGTVTGTGVVLARHTMGDRIEEVAVVVEVRSVEYLLAMGSGEGWEGEGLENLPRGGGVKVSVTQHDIWGRQFDSSPGELVVRPSRFDLVKIGPKEGGLGLSTVSKGWTVVKVWERLGAREAWLVTQVGEGVMGVTKMGLGDVADFDTVVKGAGEVGEWGVEPEGVLGLDLTTGVGVALRPGVVRVSYKVGGRSILSRTVEVTGGDRGVTLDTSVVLTGGQAAVVPLVVGEGTNLLTSLPPGLIPSSEGLLSCSATWGLAIPLEEVFSVQVGWVGGWACIFTPVGPGGPGEVGEVSLKVRAMVGALKYLPPLAVLHQRVEVGAEGGEVKVIGHSATLAVMETRHSEGLQLASPLLEAGGVSLPVALTSSHYHQDPTVTLTVPSTGQVITVSILPQIGSCTSQPRIGLVSALLSDLLTYYQSVLSIMVAMVLAAYLTIKYLGTKSATPPPKPAPAPAATPPPPKQEQQNNPSSPYLWTQDNSPIYGSPIYRRPSPSQPRNLAQYSYT